MGLEEDFAAAAEDISNNVNKTLSDDELKEVETWFVSCCSITLLYLGVCFVQARHHRRCQHFKARNAWFQGSFSQACPFLSFIVVHMFTVIRFIAITDWYLLLTVLDRESSWILSFKLFPCQGKAKWDAWNGKKGMEQVKQMFNQLGKFGSWWIDWDIDLQLEASGDWYLTMFRRKRKRSTWL